MTEARKYIQDIHGENDDKTYVAIFKKKQFGVGHFLCKTPDLYKHMENYFQYNSIVDLYMSENTFFIPKRNLGCLRWLNALYVDIDCYKKGMTKEQVLYALEKDYFDKTIPIPTKVIDSGRGLYLIWKIKPVPSQALSLWNALEKYLCKELLELGADEMSTDATRVLRVPGSINSQSNTVVKEIRNCQIEYKLHELKDEYLPVIQKKAKKEKTKKKPIPLFTSYSLYKARINDLYKLCELRRHDLQGCRERLLFLLRYYLCSVTNNTQVALFEVLALNQKFSEPLREGEVKYCTRSAEKYYRERGIKLTNTKIVEWLKITGDEQKHMEVLVDKAEKNRRTANKRRIDRRNKHGLTKRQQKKAETMTAILFYIHLGHNKHTIAQKIHLSVKMVEKYLKEARENGLNLKRKRITKHIRRVKLKRQEKANIYRLTLTLEKAEKTGRFSSEIALLDTG